MRSLSVVVVYELLKPFAYARPTAHPRVVEAIDAYFERVKPLFDEVSLGIVDPTAQPSPSKGSPIAELIYETYGVGEIVCLVESMQKRSCRISAMPSK